MNTESINTYFRLLREYRTNNSIVNEFDNWFNNLSSEIENFLKQESIKIYSDPNSQFTSIVHNPFKEKQCDYFWEESVFMFLEKLKDNIYKERFNFTTVEQFKNYIKNGLKLIYEYKNQDIKKRAIRENIYTQNEHIEIENDLERYFTIDSLGFINYTIDDHLSDEEVINNRDRRITNLERELEQSKNRNKRVIKYINCIKEVLGEQNIKRIFSGFERQQFLEKCLQIFYLYNKYGNWNDVISNDSKLLERYGDGRNTGPIRNNSKNCSNEIDNFIVNNYNNWSRVINKSIEIYRKR